MNKETFRQAILAIKEQMKINDKVAISLSAVFPNAHQTNLLPQCDIIDAYIVTLASEMKDRCSWIEHYIYELDFGSKDLEITDNGKIVPMKTIDDLFKMLER